MADLKCIYAKMILRISRIDTLAKKESILRYSIVSLLRIWPPISIILKKFSSMKYINNLMKMDKLGDGMQSKERL